MVHVHQITPFIHVPDLETALALFRDTLGFEVRYREPHYAYLELAGCGFRILEEPGRRITPDGKARMAVYVDVSDVDALYAQLQDRLDRLPPGTVETVRNKPWKQREFQVRMPDGDWLTFGQAAPS